MTDGRTVAKAALKRLEPYRRKRDFSRTPEPPPGTLGIGHRYVIQKHAARRLHYDFRLEIDGVLASWAVPNGPSLDPADKRLAVRTEDHPLEYGGFEGVIPAGEYGGGTVMLWDRGTFTPIGDPTEGLKSGRLKFRLHGKRLKGAWTLVRMRGTRREDKARENWLLIKERDETAAVASAAQPVARETTSVATRRTMEQIARDRGHTWSLTRSKLQAERAHRELRRAEGMTKGGSRLARGRAPAFVPPQLAMLTAAPPAGDQWLHEIKYDGYRMQAILHDGRARLLTRNGNDWTAKVPKVAAAIAALPARTAVLDGEMVALDAKGVTDFGALQDAISAGDDGALVFFVFDLLALDGETLRAEPLRQRKERLAKLLSLAPADGPVRYSDHFTVEGDRFFAQACQFSLEGIVSKRRNAPYRSGRNGDWLKTKCTHRQEFVVGGWLASDKAGRGLRSILVGYNVGREFVYAGKVGSGFGGTQGRKLRAQLERLRRTSPPFRSVPAEARRGARWVEPRIVVEVEFRAWTKDCILRHASLKGLRDDKPATAVRRDVPKGAGSSKAPSGKATYAGIALTHPDRVLWPEDGVTKRDLADYYEAVAEHMLPHIVGRPLSLVRCPDGAKAQCFFQRHAMPGLPDAVRRVAVRDEKAAYLAIDDAKGLFALVQFSTLEIHPWGATADDPDRPDRMIMDFDPGDGVTWPSVVAAAQECRQRLQDAGLTSFVKTTGGKGLHVVVPLARRHSWPEVKGFAQALASAMAADRRDLYTTTMAKTARRGRIFIDYLRNDRTATAIAPFSTRARSGAPVAMPIEWGDLAKLSGPAAFNIAAAPRKPDQGWAEMLRLRQRITTRVITSVGAKR